ncbi:MAG: histidine phosphatase family protein [Chitinophagales bacterium]|nr:histidine phosphatase family protein [Chitinophagales bacterium]MDW8273628.1 histidine phosphatase family protein [Chitinophagales bacterium]
MKILKELYIIRHGQTDHNAKGIVQGRGVNLPLNETGVEQSLLFFKHYKNVPFEKIYTSTLLRAKQTVAPFLELNIPHEELPELDEISWGNIEGQKLTSESDSLFQQMLEKWRRGFIHEKFPEGESPFELQHRQKKFIERIKKAPENIVLIATHGRFIRAFMCTLTNRDLSEMESFPHVNLCLYKVNYLENDSFEIKLHCDTSHLAI